MFASLEGRTSDLSQAHKGGLELIKGANGFRIEDPVPEITKC